MERGLAYITCNHGTHRCLKPETLKGLDKLKVLGYINRENFWKRASVYMESVLKDTPVSFEYGNSCFSDLTERLSKLTLPVLHEILSVGSGVALLDCYIAFKVFNAEIFRATDISPCHRAVEHLSCAQAIARYGEAQALMFTYPSFLSGGYEHVISGFRGEYIILIGELECTGHTNPGELLEQITQDFDPLTHVDMVRVRPSHGCHECFVLYKRKESKLITD